MQKTYYVYSENGQLMEHYTKDNCYDFGSLWKVRTITNKYNEIIIKDVTIISANCTYNELTKSKKDSNDLFWEKWGKQN